MRPLTFFLSTIMSFCSITVIFASQFTLPNEIHLSAKISTFEASAILNSRNTLSLKLTPSKKHYQLGDEMSLVISSNTACYLHIINFDTSGNVNLLFPNTYQQNNLLMANKVITVPNPQYKMAMSGKIGKEQLWAVCHLQSTPPFGLRHPFKQGIFLPLGKTTIFKQQYQIPPTYNPQQAVWVGLGLEITK